MSKAKQRRVTDKEARRILGRLRLKDGDLGGQVLAASNNVLAQMKALMWLSEAWPEVEATLRPLFMLHHAEWMAQFEVSKRVSFRTLFQWAQALTTTMRIMGMPPTSELLAAQAMASALAEAELRRRGFFGEGAELELV
ncbi:hypothetical protein NLY43_24140 [Mesorhizobium sp. C416B]|uniref:hypothetical protein n=1 Tax=unclassified Mesorhizobium TaxID=325217 RepID=UPI0003CE9BF5|nr:MULTISPECIES: hypothetical protein [unclassified Mesorhizobium]ESX49395.1 hypothetical protein X762_10975 [Mesorhizobium sp. LSHC426A00]ESX55694.1 hypothetical protein X761_14030 [Mesorhizobium sp. LSHC424B00]ESX70516.1 hypothetical protein X758_16885 [Mesorhizobium sp. LSHC416B00]WJI61677.1 hypothetical protein NLY43_24140 [Mesorhizobium sp. C416B]